MASPMDMAKDYDFFDLGASKGGSLNWASGVFGGRGCGVDMSPRKVEMLRKRGFDGIVADAATIDLPANSVRYVTMLDFLEHLPGAEVAEKIIAKAIDLASDFVLMTGPDFGNEKLLRAAGYKRYYACWKGHSWHHTASDLNAILSRQSGVEWAVLQAERIRDSSDRCVVPLEAPDEGGPYTLAHDGTKALEDLTLCKVYRILAFVAVKPGSAMSLDEIIVRGVMRPSFTKGGRSNAPRFGKVTQI